MICVDIDGVLADARHRQHYVDGRYRDYDSFFAEAGEDGLLAQQAVMLETFAEDHTLAMVTSRPAWIGGITAAWLEEHEIRWHLLIMRSNFDYRPAPVVKTEAVAQLRGEGFDPVLAFDDDRRNVAAYAAVGVPCVYIHSGYHD